MMNILSRYIGKVIISSILMVLLLLVGIESFMELASELKDIGKGNYHFTQALLTVPLMLPIDIYQLFPMAALIGSLMGLGKLANQSELVVMSSVGLSRLQIIRAMILATCLLLIVVSVMGEWIAPKSKYYARNLKSKAITLGQTLKTTQGVWFRDGNNFIFVREITNDNQLGDITRYKFDNARQLQLASHAHRGAYENGRWTFYKINESDIFNDHVVSATYPMQTWDIHLDKRLLGVSEIEPDQMTLPKLYSYLKYRQKNDLGAGLYEFNFWKRLAQPWATLVMIFLAVPFIFGPLRTVSMGLRVLTGVIIGFTFYIMNQFFGPISLVYQFPALLAAVLPTITFAIVGTFLLFLKA